MLLPTAILQHTLPDHSAAEPIHYDWLLTYPPNPAIPAYPPSELEPDLTSSPENRLLAFQTTIPPQQWPDLSAPLPLQRIFDHRQRYLTYEGPISNDRGHVIQAAIGHHKPSLWLPQKIVTDLQIHTSCQPGQTLNLQATLIAIEVPSSEETLPCQYTATFSQIQR
ncbi:hypothetical protein [Poriferisphaera sp. WC338]|uniref:hypothetical protein n=1 Tax=Poriferisphaera sp. WC338 TaxID=3425129 RepID=UPI003D819CA0